jgi:DNA-binding transcriptional MerR regulator
LDYAGSLDKIADVIGRENIIVRKFAKESWVNQSIIDDFMSCIGLEVTDEFKPLEQDSNLSLEGNTAEIKRIINSSDAFSQEDRLYLGSFLRSESPESGRRYPCCMMSQEEIREFLQKYEEGNARVASEYIGDHAPLFSDEIRDLPKWQPDNPYMTADVVCFFSSVALELRRENEKLRQENIDLRRELLRENEDLRREIQELRTQVKDDKADLRAFKYKLHHPLRALWNLLFHRNK